MIKFFLGFSSIAILLIACTNAKGPIPTVKTLSSCDTAYWYTGVIEPIITANCATSGCHDVNGSAPGDFTTYTGVKIYADNGQINNRVLVLKNMPSNKPLSDAQLARISCFLEHGAQQNNPAGVTGSTGIGNACTTTISYSSTIAPLIASYCATSGCHSTPGSTTNGVDYTSYSGLKTDVDNGTLNNRVVVLKNMPVFPVTHILTAIELSNIDCWIKQGGLNN